MDRVVDRAVEALVDRAVSHVTKDEQSQARAARERLRQKQAEVLAEAASSPSSTGGTPGVERPDSGNTDPGGIRRLAEDEDCPVCTALLERVAEMGEPRRTKGVAEYGEFRSALADGGDEAAEALRETEVLIDAAQRVDL
jgi:hypothetical protein